MTVFLMMLSRKSLHMTYTSYIVLLPDLSMKGSTNGCHLLQGQDLLALVIMNTVTWVQCVEAVIRTCCPGESLPAGPSEKK